MDHLRVDPDLAFNTSRSVSNDAVELHEQLDSLQRDWDNLSGGWSGAASSAYSPLWAEWLDGATTLVDRLEELAHKVAAAAARYVDQDGSAAASIDSTAVDLRL
ncbi:MULTISPECIES: WXG100 family type VII secretion target [Mycolicibacterium]|uniref:WXG100 family type VII secretion target n=1 Tax=Mycolicibacterium TaxID=1866885 RepID=UPI0023BAE60F|nr:MULTISPECIES: WXG100 family type VII secretion target [Mycolicibacterium]MDW5614062.1 WXG100 family type VII secretion target [Mycolicibacterium sp. D5.8-2]